MFITFELEKDKIEGNGIVPFFFYYDAGKHHNFN
jgi:hypothetical protein